MVCMFFKEKVSLNRKRTIISHLIRIYIFRKKMSTIEKNSLENCSLSGTHTRFISSYKSVGNIHT